MKLTDTRIAIALMAFVFMGNIGIEGVFAQEHAQGADIPVTAAVRAEVIKTILAKLNESYVFPEVAKKMEAAILKHQESGQYDNVTSSTEFAALLTANLQEISKDKHLRVRYQHDLVPADSNDGGADAEMLRRFTERGKQTNFGFQKVEVLEGNIGYIDLRQFFDASMAGETAAAAMTILGNTNALIIDLRHNGGGDPAMVCVLCSYLFPGGDVHLNDLYFRPSNSTQQFWTLPYLPGKRYVDKEVYVLTSSRTFSGAEEFTYNLKNLKRATIVGETTGGGANPGGPVRAGDHFTVFVPVGRAINPITKTNWEGTGVEPDVRTSQEQALKTAQIMALKKLRDQTKDASRKDEITEVIGRVEKSAANSTL
jgi:hypothetical protein